jgi:hypothetical protein
VIRKDQAHKHYSRNTPVINRGDPGWTSDNHLAGRRGERYGANPLSLIDQKIRQRAAREVDMSMLPSVDEAEVGDVVGVAMENNRDVMFFRLVEHVMQERTKDGETLERRRRQWKTAYTQKNAAL